MLLGVVGGCKCREWTRKREQQYAESEETSSHGEWLYCTVAVFCDIRFLAWNEEMIRIPSRGTDPSSRY